jgi:hypothetical protein
MFLPGRENLRGLAVPVSSEVSPTSHTPDSATPVARVARPRVAMSYLILLYGYFNRNTHPFGYPLIRVFFRSPKMQGV